MSTTQIKLQFPVQIDAMIYDSLTIRRCKVRDRRAAMKQPGTDADREVWLFASLCEVPPEVIDELDEADYGKLQETFVSFRGAAGAA